MSGECRALRVTPDQARERERGRERERERQRGEKAQAIRPTPKPHNPPIHTIKYNQN